VADTFASFNRRVVKFQKELSDDALLHEIGKMAKAEATKAASADLGGDDSFSGWNKKKPIPLDTRYDIVGPGRLSFHPSRRSAGPWTVAEHGRNQTAGPSLRSSSLTPTGRRRRAGATRRWNGQTRGKQTASDALAAIEPKVPKIVDRRIGRAIRKSF
jgi:hypothetical protein